MGRFEAQWTMVRTKDAEGKEQKMLKCDRCGKLEIPEESRFCMCTYAAYCSESCRSKDEEYHQPYCKLALCMVMSAHAVYEEIRTNRSFTCAGCGKRNNNGTRFQTCQSCKTVNYCSKQCQKKHWKENHRDRCRLKHRLAYRCKTEFMRWTPDYKGVELRCYHGGCGMRDIILMAPPETTEEFLGWVEDEKVRRAAHTKALIEKWGPDPDLWP